MRVLIVLVIVAALGGGSAYAAWENEQLAEPVVVDAAVATPVTPMLSMRRVPHALLEPRRDAAVAAAVATIPERLPGNSCLVVTEAGRDLFEYQPAVPLVPASTQKVPVGAALLDLVAPDATFETTVWSQAPIVDGVIAGDVWLVGGGDPLLTTEPYRARNGDLQRPSTPFEGMADALLAAGVTRIEGSVIGDGTRYDQVYDVPSWPERYREQVSAGPLAGLTVNDGLTSFTPELVAINPGTPAENPPAHAAQVLIDLLVERQVVVGGTAGSGEVPADAQQIASLPSLPVSEIVTEMVHWSDNTTAELLLKELGVQVAGEGSTVAGGSALVATLAGMGIDVEGLNPVDGSGLALNNQITCSTLTDVLDQGGPESPLAGTLATAGVSGTLRNRLIDTPGVGRVIGKTGSLRHVNALTGFARTDTDRVYTFAIISNLADREYMPAIAGELQDELMLSLVTLPEVPVSPELEPLDPIAP